MGRSESLPRSKMCMIWAVFLLAAVTQDFAAASSDEYELGTTASTDYDYGDRTGGGEDSDEYQDLELDEEMRDQNLVSGGRLMFRCRVSVSPKRPLTYTWYKNNMKLELGDDLRITIRDRDWGSRLQIVDVYTADSGLYRCEASDGEKSVITSARLEVTFNRPPDDGNTHIDTDIFQGKCEMYSGYACSQYLKGKMIYVESFQDQKDMEQQIIASLGLVGNKEKVSKKCSDLARPAFCHYVFPLCEKIVPGSEAVEEEYSDEYGFTYVGGIIDDDDASEVDEGIPTAIRLCREDCELLKHDVCAQEFTTDDELIKQLVRLADCSKLPKTTATGAKCTRLGLKSVVDNTHVCYNGTGTGYQGLVATSQSGQKCRPWPTKMLTEYPELAGGHNFCRNPGNGMNRPWCYTNRDRTQQDPCGVPKCKIPSGGTSDLLMILIPCVSIPVLIGCILLVMCFVCRKGKNKDSKHHPGKKVEMKSLVVKKTQIPEIPGSLVHFLLELGEGKYGKVYKAQILNNMTYCPPEPVAVKSLSSGAMQSQAHDFQREIDMFSELQHPNVSCLKALVSQPNMRCMVFEYTSRVDLHELLTMHSPHSDIGGGKIASSASSQTSNSLESSDFVHMAVQIAAGLEYLSSRNFVHRDLAARNVLVLQNNVMKISNLGVVRDCYLSSYYRSPQGGHMLPIRWMAPESLKSNQFSEKSVVWSFGVMIWEIFSYGMQPYCGYNNHEVIEMIGRGQTLSCPDQCSARVYSLMHECWATDPVQRPVFKDIHAKLSGWEGSSTTRMTSQLAQGIHRQLTNVMRDGTQFAQYSPPQGTVIDGFNQPYGAMSPPQPGPPHVSPASQPYYTSPSGTSSSGVVSSQPPSYPSYMQQQHAYPAPQMYPQPQAHYTRPHPVSYPYKSSHTHSSSRSSESGASSVRNQYMGHQNRPSYGGPTQQHPQQQYPGPQPASQPHLATVPQYENFHQRTPDSGVHSVREVDAPVNQSDEIHGSSSPTHLAQPVRPRPGSEVIPPSDGLRVPLSVFTNAQHSNSANNVNGQSQAKPVVAPKPPMSPVDQNRSKVVMGLNGQRNRNHNNHVDGPAGDPRRRVNSSDVQSAGSSPSRPQTANQGPVGRMDAQKQELNGKAMSCDSGLPADEPDHEAPEDQPFLSQQPNGRISFRQPNKPVPHPGSSSSSMSGSTAITAESRLTS